MKVYNLLINLFFFKIYGIEYLFDNFYKKDNCFHDRNSFHEFRIVNLCLINCWTFRHWNGTEIGSFNCKTGKLESIFQCHPFRAAFSIFKPRISIMWKAWKPTRRRLHQFPFETIFRDGFTFTLPTNSTRDFRILLLKNPAKLQILWISCSKKFNLFKSRSPLHI